MADKTINHEYDFKNSDLGAYYIYLQYRKNMRINKIELKEVRVNRGKRCYNNIKKEENK